MKLPLPRSLDCHRLFSSGPQRGVRQKPGARWISQGPKDPNFNIVSITGVPLFHGQSLVGTQHGPQALRERNLIDRIRGLGYMVEDLGDMTLPTQSKSGVRGRFADLIGRGAHEAAKNFAEIASDPDKCVVTLGGDHSVGIATVVGQLAVRQDVGIIWVDAHADINTPGTSNSGNFHGMPIGLAMKLEDPATIPHFEWMCDWPTLKPEQIVYIGLRALDPPEKLRIQKLGIKAFSMHEIDRYGIGKVMDMSLEHLADRPLHVSFDIDACDPIFAGSTGTTVRAGLTYRESSYIMEALAESGRVTGIDLVEVNPMLKANLKVDTAETGVSLIESALGERTLYPDL